MDQLFPSRLNDVNQYRTPDLAAPVSEIDHILGSSKALVTIVEYGDFECPDCKQAAPVVKLLLQRHAGRIRFAYRHFPLREVHPNALAAAEAAECAAAQGKFWEMHDLLFENQSHLQTEHLRNYAQRLELDLTRYDAEMEQHFYVQRVREHMQSGQHSHVRGTPGFFVNGRTTDVSFNLQTLFDATESALQRR